MKRAKGTKRTYSFILLELMMALFLVILASGYLFNWPLNLIRKEVHLLQKIEFQRLAENDFALLKERFYRNEIPWEEFDHEKDLKRPFSSEILEYTFDEDFKLRYKREVFLWSKSSEHSTPSLRPVSIRLNYQPWPPRREKVLQFTHCLFLKRDSLQNEKQ